MKNNCLGETCLGENTEKCITFTVPIENEVTRRKRRIDENGEEVTKNISYILQFIDSARFMVKSLSNLLNNLSKRIHKIECKCGHDDKKCETCGLYTKYATVSLNTQTSKMI